MTPTPTEEQRFRIVSDDDGHSFVIPADKVPEWEEYLRDIYDRDLDPEPREWAREIGGCVSLVTFTNPVIE